MSMDLVLTNARVVTPSEAFLGTVVVRDGRIARIDTGRSAVAGAQDLEEDLLIPGLVDVHTDNLEKHMMPRPGVRWSSRAALLSHDAQVAAAGITTVLDALCVGEVEHADQRDQMFREGVAELRALAPRGLLRAEHFLHLRCEISVEGMRESFALVAGDPLVRMVSLMDHTPGVGQFADIEKYKRKNARNLGMNEQEAEAYIGRRWAMRERVREPNRAAILAAVAGRDVALASHDDRTEEEVSSWAEAGIAISEFPVTAVAAEAARRHGMGIVAGAPNIVRGGSHSGNVRAADLMRDGLVDVFASDYVPGAMLAAALMVHEKLHVPLPAAIATISQRPALMVGLADRGAIAPKLRADLVQVHLADGHPLVRQVWREGKRIA
ncbi:alpha-D-ribose 1-methylphosphonate 5-triphosphate diphosphatase [Elioraea rosea]|uniref:alpha-D-ribose 1-methylphosphonate 5-triphosphate diphosphatase n=1 Tax=Elioraea rosea TaxID=2492390 RepID=UPI0011867E4D|nr:alpha-D-ribose 1-methylphosphonate 5-triphosphate diphosphatase [Elioraea rosea]